MVSGTVNRLLPQGTINRLNRRRRPASLVITSVKIPRALDKALKAEARRQNCSSSYLIREALASYISFRTAGKP